MRPIEFRVWHKERKVMYWFNLLWGNRDGTGEGWLCGVPWREDRIPRFMKGDNREELDPDKCEIMQYTGLLDRHGLKIWEGDVVNLRIYQGVGIQGDAYDWEQFTVEWSDKEAGFRFVDFNHQMWKVDDSNQIEVFGNIYENPIGNEAHGTPD